MEHQELMHYWYYFCSLCSQLNHTKQYVDHNTVDKNGKRELANGDTFSNEFLKILLSSASEFETVGKLLCKEIDPNNEKNNIISISETILNQYPNIIQTTVTTDFQDLIPLSKWEVSVDSSGQKKIVGLDWWRAYTNIKHKRYAYFQEATLKHCINALASLLVIELYLGMHVNKSVSDLSTHGCDYFYFRYGHEQFWVKCPQSLPDF
jgi:hypothetical protein